MSICRQQLTQTELRTSTLKVTSLPPDFQKSVIFNEFGMFLIGLEHFMNQLCLNHTQNGISKWACNPKIGSGRTVFDKVNDAKSRKHLKFGNASLQISK